MTYDHDLIFEQVDNHIKNCQKTALNSRKKRRILIID